MRYFILLLSLLAVTFSMQAYSQGDTLRQSCYQSMRYNVSVQLAGTAYTKFSRDKYTGEAFESGKFQGISKDETRRMILIASENPSSIQFSYHFQDDESFANGYMSSYLNDCMQNPKKYISQ